MGTFAERYVPDGYLDVLPVERQLEILAGIDGITGLNIFYPLAGLPTDPVKLTEKLSQYGLRVSNVAVDNFGVSRWKNGGFCDTDPAVRKETIKYAKASIDLAAATNADSLLLWPAHDGFDYPFQVNYAQAWYYMVDTMREIAAYNSKVKVAIEAKIKDPRQKMLVSNTGKLMMLLNEIGADHFGGALDVGHLLQAQENISEALTVMNAKGKLTQIHLNDNYRDADPDMIFGTINFWEVIEFFYYLLQTDYEGWLSIDIIGPRDDRVMSLKAAVQVIKKYMGLAEKLLSHKAEIDKNIEANHFADNLLLITDILF